MKVSDKLNVNSLIAFFICLLMISLYFGRFNIYLGFSLKPYMILFLINLFLFYRYMKFTKLTLFEWAMICFILLFSITAFNFNYPDAQLRFLFVIIIIIMFYFSTRGLISRLNTQQIEKMLSIAGVIGVSSSFAYYLMGVVSTGLTNLVNRTSYYGLLVDRSIPRLTGTTSTDPNIFVFYVTLYFCYTLSNLKSNVNKVGFVISAITIVLTYSRGALLSIAAALIISFFIGLSRKKQLKIAGALIFLLFILYRLPIFEGFISTIKSRFTRLLSDGGSGRLELWKDAFETFSNYPFFGIGINSTLNYNKEHYGTSHYIHNTFLEVLSESGVFIFLIYVLFWISLLYCSLKLYRKHRNLKFLFITVIAMFFQMNFLSILYNEAFYFMVLILYKYYSDNFYNESKI